MSCSDGIKSILLVEDEPVICEVCMKVLTRAGYDVEIAANGQEGEDKLKERRYDLIIIDMRTPVMDGQQLYYKIGEDHPYMIGRVLMTTGDMVCSDTQRFLEKSGAPFLPKPFTSEELKKAVEDALGEERGQLQSGD